MKVSPPCRHSFNQGVHCLLLMQQCLRMRCAGLMRALPASALECSTWCRRRELCGGAFANVDCPGCPLTGSKSSASLSANACMQRLREPRVELGVAADAELGGASSAGTCLQRRHNPLLYFSILQQCLSTAGTGEPQAEEDEDAVEAAKAAKEEYNRMLQEQETSLQQRHTDKMQVRP